MPTDIRFCAAVCLCVFALNRVVGKSFVVFHVIRLDVDGVNCYCDLWDVHSSASLGLPISQPSLLRCCD